MTATTKRDPGYRAAAATVRIGVRHLLNIDLDVDGLDRIPDGGVIVVANHLSALDGLAIGMVLAEAGRQPMALVEPAEMHHPLYALLHRAGAILLGMSSTAVKSARDAVWSGRPVIVMPEAVPSASLEVGTFSLEAAHLAIETEAPMLPAAIFGTQRLFDDGVFRPQRGTAVALGFGHPMEVMGDQDYDVTRRLRMDIEVLLDQAMTGYRDREEGEAGARWWPARRGGGAPPAEPVPAVDAERISLDDPVEPVSAEVRRAAAAATAVDRPDRPMPQAASAAPIISHVTPRPPRWNVGVQYRGDLAAKELLKGADVHLDLAGLTGFGRVEPANGGLSIDFRIDAIDLTAERLHVQGTLTQEHPLTDPPAVQPAGTSIDLVAVPS